VTEKQTPAPKTDLVAPPPPPKPGTFAYLLIQAKGSIESVIPRHLSAERLMKIARVAWGRSPKLQECTAQSLITCVMEAAELGLDVSGTLGTAYLVPFKNQGKYEATLIIGYRGLIELARRSGMIQSVESRAVFHGEKFEMTHGMSPSLRHEPDIDANPAEKDFRGCYMVARLKDGGTHVEWMNKGEIDRIRNQSKAGKFGPWKDHYIEMAKKTVLRRGFKMLPMSPEMVSAFTHSDDVEFPGEIIDTTFTEAVEPGEAGNTKIAALKGALAPAAKVADQVAELQTAAKETELAEVVAEGQAQVDPTKKVDAANPAKVSGDASAEPPEDYVNPVVATIRPAPSDQANLEPSDDELLATVEVEPEPEPESEPEDLRSLPRSIVDERYDVLREIIGKRAFGENDEVPDAILDSTTEKWLASKKWTKTAIKDDSLWKIVFGAANKARFRKTAAAASK
jgi:recombination protein RecT